MTPRPPPESSRPHGVPNPEDPRHQAQSWYLERRDQEVLWERLRGNARDALRNMQDVQLQSVIRQSLQEMVQMPDRPPPTSEEAVALVARILDLANQRLEPRQAAIYLAYTHWDYRAAVERYIEERFGEDEEPLSDPESGRTDLGFDSQEQGMEKEEKDGEVEVEEDVEEEDFGDDNADGLAPMRRLNRDIDRRGPIKGVQNDAMLVIRIQNLNGKPDTVKRYLDVHPGPIDWTRDGRTISRWRSQVFRRALGGVREGRTKYHELEKEWLVDAHFEFERRCREADLEVNWRQMDWRQLAIEFNRRFQGQILRGDPTPRPARSALSLRNEKARIRAITDLTRLKPKDQKPGK
ncbi:hypothetical protein MMC08_006272 [Hypocenomyce scalaris]|nr:hypothetical protein [Hypocenomyce scalaris]